MNKTSLLNISLLLVLFGLNAGNTHAQSTTTTSPDVPKNLQVPPEQSLIFKAAAKGSQIYVCKAKPDNLNAFEWTLKAPDAVLFNEQGQPLGKHYAGPTWESNDGSKVIGQVKVKADAPQTSTIPWLLLEGRSHQGNGIFSQVNWIQRLHTVGGKAPAQGCDRAHANREVKVNYQADYYFWGVPGNKGVKRH
ncbi:DUF3455 domain-containing protein [Nostoc sp. 106C]|uniref:DUF3455 domain-containing protein n=1 Tax=Nostoc sp. 106C TaxID=1932667 RepID=UPI000A39A851|nr:DUF3455 domain-containing protein [Nostoc sp. 106C]OUL29574.1 hypothetical protein BV375_15585 [Nostoc sp. 106C]